MSVTPATPFIFASSQKGLPSSDTFSLNGANCPGKCELISCSATQSWDVRAAQGYNWATVVANGEKLSEPVFLVEIWEGLSQYPAWLAYALKYLSRPAGAPPSPTVASAAYAFYHDIASVPPYSIMSVLIQGVDYRGRGEGGSFLHAVKLLEFKKAAAVLGARPDQSQPPSTQPIPTALTALQQHNLDVASQINDLATKQGIPGWGLGT